MSPAHLGKTAKGVTVGKNIAQSLLLLVSDCIY